MSLYASKDLECAESYVKSLCGLIVQKRPKCCICGNDCVSLWLVDETRLLKGLVVYVRLFCGEHEKLWKDGKRLDYKQLNGLMLLRLPYQMPVGLWTDVSWEDFVTLLTNYFGNKKIIEDRLIPEIVSPCEEFLKKNPKFVLKGAIGDYLKMK